MFWLCLCLNLQKQPSRSVLRKSYSENMQQIYKRALMPKCDFNKIAKQLFWNHTSSRCSPVNLLHIFRKTSRKHLWMAASEPSSHSYHSLCFRKFCFFFGRVNLHLNYFNILNCGSISLLLEDEDMFSSTSERNTNCVIWSWTDH